MYDVNRQYERAHRNGTAVQRMAPTCAGKLRARDRRTDPRRPRPWCTHVLRTITHTPHPTGWHAHRRFGLC